MMAAAVQVVGGVDPHADTMHVAALTAIGKVIGDAEFPRPRPATGARSGSSLTTGRWCESESWAPPVTAPGSAALCRPSG